MDVSFVAILSIRSLERTKEYSTTARREKNKHFYDIVKNNETLESTLDTVSSGNDAIHYFEAVFTTFFDIPFQ